MTYSQIIKQIMDGLSGDNERDVKFLTYVSDQYANSYLSEYTFDEKNDFTQENEYLNGSPV